MINETEFTRELTRLIIGEKELINKYLIQIGISPSQFCIDLSPENQIQVVKNNLMPLIKEHIELEKKHFLNELGKVVDAMIYHFLDNFDVKIEELDLLEGRQINECPSEVAYLKALINCKKNCNEVLKNK